MRGVKREMRDSAESGEGESRSARWPCCLLFSATYRRTPERLVGVHERPLRVPLVYVHHIGMHLAFIARGLVLISDATEGSDAVMRWTASYCRSECEESPP